MRGTPRQWSSACYQSGIIPAYAGNTSPTNPGESTLRDHPRVCGEHMETVTGFSASLGSSPRMRGTQQRHGAEGHGGGIIPAYAGNTPRPARPSSTIRDHPRVCGEHFASPLVSPAGKGSSPRMRGTHAVRYSAEAWTGIIPAYAGNTTAARGRRPRGRDHPRVCGEHALWQRAFIAALGSSPRMRGTQIIRPPSKSILWIIPAYAGNTNVASLYRESPWDHPRVCGEHTKWRELLNHLKGSSPRMRGTLVVSFRHSAGAGIIPAYAGNTLRD